MDRQILHVDMNGFYASVEMIFHPEARDVPMAVGGDAQARHGVILAKNELAKQRGVKTAETIWQARKKCPELLLLPPHHDLYRSGGAGQHRRKLSGCDGEPGFVWNRGGDRPPHPPGGEGGVAAHRFGGGVFLQDLCQNRQRLEKA